MFRIKAENNHLQRPKLFVQLVHKVFQGAIFCSISRFNEPYEPSQELVVHTELGHTRLYMYIWVHRNDPFYPQKVRLRPLMPQTARNASIFGSK